MRCSTLWIGPSLGPVERACMLSVLRQGHDLSLYCYRRPSGVPRGVEVRDAAEVLPEQLVITHESGSVALFSDRFRFELQRLGAGTWLDTDVYLLAPLDEERSYLFGYEDSSLLGAAVLRLPPDSPMLPPLLEVFEERTVPRWLRRRDRRAARRRLKAGGRTGLAQMPWGVAGPRALSAVACAQGFDGWALAPEVFYPAHYHDARWICDPAIDPADVVTPRTVAVHLWNRVIAPFKNAPAPPGSFLARLQAEGSAAPAAEGALRAG